MNIWFLGTSHGAPTPGRACQSVLIQTEQGDYLFDAGAPVMDILVNSRYDLTRLKAVFVSHRHPDHWCGLVHMVDLASWHFKDMRYAVYIPEQYVTDALRNFCGAFHALTDRIDYRLIQEGTFFDDGNITVTAVHTEHMRASVNICYGFLIEAEGKRVMITGDLHPSLEDFPTALLQERTHALITECAHFEPEALLEKLACINADQVMVVHVNPQSRYDGLKQLSGQSKCTVLYPNDNDKYPV